MSAAIPADSDGDDETAVGGMRSRGPNPLLTSWRQALLTIVGMSISVGLVALVDPLPGTLVLAGVLAMTMARNRLVVTWRGRLEAIIVLPAVGLATAGVASLFVVLPVVGAIAFVGAMFLSVWLRRFGPVLHRIGSLIALPFITLLIAPGAGVGTTPLGVAALSVVVLVTVVALRLIAEVTRFVSAAQPEQRQPSMPDSSGGTAPASSTRPTVSTRMAVQLAIALVAAFVIGALVFPQHVGWVVLTAFIVCSGNRGRADVLYKSGLRIVGAAIGTVVAARGIAWLAPLHALPQGPTLVVTVLIILGAGLWLREWTYAAWAVVMTLVITLLQGAAIPVVAGTGAEQLWIRILAILVGAACGLSASWFVLPVRSEGVVRKRLSEALAALSEYASEQSEFAEYRLDSSLQRLDEIAAPWNALQRFTGWRATARKPGQWIELVHECARLIRLKPRLDAGARRALGNARRAVREPDTIGPALLVFHDELTSRR